MLISAASVPEQFKASDFSTLEHNDLFIAWKGVVFQYGARAGAESMKRLAAGLAQQPLTELCQTLHGIFVLFVFDKAKELWSVAVDNAGLYHAFYSPDRVGTRFLDMLAAQAVPPMRLDPGAAAEFLAHGGVYWSRTLVEDIRKIAYNEIIELGGGEGQEQARRRIISKRLPPQDSIAEEHFLRHYAHLAAALEGQRLSVDLTGGIDSRLCACLLARQGMDFEVAVSGRPGIPDVVIAEQAARLLHKPFHPTVHDTSSIEDEVQDLFRRCDGLSDILSYHRLGQMQAARRQRGIEVAISGDGGGLYKDFWWLQDFPFYRSPKPNFARLYDLRVEPIRLPSTYLVGAAADAYADLRRRTIEKFMDLRAATNTESYDNAYFFYKMSESAGRFATNHINNYVAVLCPLLDYHNFCLSYSLPHTQRIFNRFPRQVLSMHCPDLADLVTADGVKPRIGHVSIVADLCGYGVNRTRRLIKKAAERTLRRRLLASPSLNDPRMVPRVQCSATFQQAVAALKEAGLVNPELKTLAIRAAHVGRFLTLGLLVRHLGG